MTRSEGGRKGAAISIAQRRAEKAEGMAAARAWRAERAPVPASGHMPFEGHRTQAQVAADEAAKQQRDIAA